MKSKEALDLVNRGIEALANELENGKSDNLQKFLSFAATFHNYSINNWFMIFSQKPNATRVAGYKTWQKLGRHVRKGEKSIKILAPRRGKKKDKDDKEQEFLYFVTTSVFDVSQTEGDDLPSVFRIDGDPGQEAMESLEGAVKSQGIKLEDKDCLGGALGRSHGGKIEILSSLTRPERYVTLVHELAHEILHKDLERRELSKAVKETEAEAVSFIVGQAVGLDTLNQAADYVQLWNGDLNIFKKSLKRIQKCATTIIGCLK